MTIEESTIRNIEDFVNQRSYVIVNKVVNTEEGESIVKELLNVSSIPTKDMVNTIEQQNGKLVGVIQSLLGKVTNLEAKIKELEEKCNKQPESVTVDNSDISRQLEEMERKLNANILE